MMSTTVAIIIAVTVVLVGSAYFLGCSLGGKKKGDGPPITDSANSGSSSLPEAVSADLEELKNLKRQVSDLKASLKEKEQLLNSNKSGDTSGKSDALQKEITALNQKIEKLSKDLSDAEEERDDYEDEAKSAARKLKSKTEEYSKLSSEMSVLSQKMETLQRDYDEKTDELKEKERQNEEQKESIAFVNAILNAKEASDESTVSRNEAIDRVRNTLWNYYDSLEYWDLGENREHIPELAFQWANERKKPWLKGKKVVALIGEFSAGKTSIVNRILSQDNPNAPQLPISSKATTAIPTYISYWTVFNSQFLDPNGKLKNIDKEDFERVNKDVLNKVNVSSLLQYFVMSYNNDYLKGLTVLDTPGFSSSDPEDERRTCDVINEADVLFWVFDANQAINKTSVNIIKTNIKDVPLFIVMNKCDLLSPNEQKAKEDNLRKILQKEQIPIKGVIRFGKTVPVNVLMKAAGSIESRKEDKIIEPILEDLYGLYDSIDEEYKACQKAVIDAKQYLETTQENIQFYLEQYEEDAERIGKMPYYKDTLIRRDFYRIDLDDYGEFKGRCQRILENTAPLQTEISDLRNVSDYLPKGESEMADLKQKRKMLQKYENEIRAAVLKYDPNMKDKLPIHVLHTNSDSSPKKQSRKQGGKAAQNSSSNVAQHSQYDGLRPVKTGRGFIEDLQTFKNKTGEPDLLKADILYLAEQYNIYEESALYMARQITQNIRG